MVLQKEQQSVPDVEYSLLVTRESSAGDADKISNLPRYAKLEIERRWLVEGEHPSLEQPKTIEDLYMRHTRLRLRLERFPDGSCVYKLCRKYGHVGPQSEPITNLYLNQAEYDLLATLPGARLCKRRYAVSGGALDVHDHPQAGLILFEREFASEMDAGTYIPPDFVGREVTDDPMYSGATLAGLIYP